MGGGLAKKESNWVKRRWGNLEKQMSHMCNHQGWRPEFETEVPAIIRSLLQFYPENRMSSAQLADALSKGAFLDVAGPVHRPKQGPKPSTVNESFAEGLGKVKDSEERGRRVREKLKDLVETPCSCALPFGPKADKDHSGPNQIVTRFVQPTDEMASPFALPSGSASSSSAGAPALPKAKAGGAASGSTVAS